MAVPDFQTLMLPLLQFASDGNEHSIRDARETLAAKFKLSDEERKALLPSGRQPVFDNRVAWAKVYLQQAGVVDSPRRGYFRINLQLHHIQLRSQWGDDVEQNLITICAACHARIHAVFATENE